MIHVALFILCIVSIEIFVRLNFLNYLESIQIIVKKVVGVLPNKNISDHWKEFVIPIYALKIMKNSLSIIAILLMIVIIFFVVDLIIDGFIIHTLSFKGIAESILIVVGYVFFKKVLSK